MYIFTDAKMRYCTGYSHAELYSPTAPGYHASIIFLDTFSIKQGSLTDGMLKLIKKSKTVARYPMCTEFVKMRILSRLLLIRYTISLHI